MVDPPDLRRPLVFLDAAFSAATKVDEAQRVGPSTTNCAIVRARNAANGSVARGENQSHADQRPRTSEEKQTHHLIVRNHVVERSAGVTREKRRPSRVCEQYEQ